MQKSRLKEIVVFATLGLLIPRRYVHVKNSAALAGTRPQVPSFILSNPQPQVVRCVRNASPRLAAAL